jgi:hypothetical protein
MQIPILAGRDIEERDRPGSPRLRGQRGVREDESQWAESAGAAPDSTKAVKGDPLARDMEIVGDAETPTLIDCGVSRYENFPS